MRKEKRIDAMNVRNYKLPNFVLGGKKLSFLEERSRKLHACFAERDILPPVKEICVEKYQVQVEH